MTLAPAQHQYSTTGVSLILDEYEQTDVGLFPSDWVVRRVGDLCRLVNGRGFKPHEWRTRGLPIIRIQNLNGSDEFNYFDGAYSPKLEVHPGQLLFAWSGSRGTSFGPHVWKGPLGLLNYHTWKVVVDNDAVSSAFFYHALKGLTEYIESWAHGASALVHVQKWQMEAFQLAIPPTVREQEAIADVLSDVDALIESIEDVVKKKRATKKAVMQAVLSSDRRLGNFRDPWNRKKLGNMVVTSITDGPHLTPAFLDDGVPFLSVNNLVDNRLDFQDVRYVSRYDHEVFSKKCRPRRKDILMGKAASVGKVAIVESDVEFNIWSPIAVIRLNEKEFCPHFVFYQLQSEDLSRQIRLLTNASSQGNLGMADIEKLEIPHPELSEQRDIAQVLCDIDDEIAALVRRRTKARAVKQGLMQELLTGRIRLA